MNQRNPRGRLPRGFCFSRVRQGRRRLAAAPVWFGEAVPNISLAAEEASKADIFVVIGTSFNVYPAAGLIYYVPAEAPIYIIDPKEVKVENKPQMHFLRTVASKGMEELTQILQKYR